MKGKDFCVCRTKKQVAEPVVGSRYVLGKYEALDKLIRWIVQEHDKEQLTPSFYQFPSTNWMTSYSPILFRCSIAQRTFISTILGVQVQPTPRARGTDNRASCVHGTGRISHQPAKTFSSQKGTYDPDQSYR